MQRLRSRWTVVALGPAFFLTGFAVVSALTDGSGDATPVLAEPGSGEETAALPTTVSAPPTVTVPTEGVATTGVATTTAADDGSGSGGDGSGGGNWPASLAPGRIEVDYGGWEGVFEVEASEIVPEIGLATVTGEVRYLGGADCQLGRVEMRGRFYNADGAQIGKGSWDSTWATGEGAEIPQREPLYLEFYGDVGETAEAAYLRFTNVECL